MPAPADAARLIDEFGQLDQQIQAFTPTIERHKHLAATIRSWYADADPDESISAEGKKFAVILTARATERKIASMWAVYKAFGSIKNFVSVCSMTLIALETALGKEKAQALLVEKQTGSRRLKVVPRMAKAA